MRQLLRLSIILLILLAALPAVVFAGDKIQIIHLNFILRDDIRACRYQINTQDKDSWTLVDMNDPSTEWVSDDKLGDRVFYQYTFDGRNWSNSFELNYNPMTDNWEHPFTALGATTREQVVAGPSVSIGGMYVRPVSEMPENMYERGYGGTFRYETPQSSYHVFSEVSYWKGDSTHELIETIHTGLAGVGLGYRVELGSLSLKPEIGGGLLIEIPVHTQCGFIRCFDGYGKAGLSLSSHISDEQEIFLRGDALIFTGKSDYAIEAAITAGTSMLL